MTDIDTLNAYTKSLQTLCTENGLRCILNFSSYPLQLTICPDEDVDQPRLFGPGEDEPIENASSCNAEIILSFRDGVLIYKMSERFVIDDALFSKIRNKFKQLHYTYLQIFHRLAVERKLNASIPFPIM